MDHQEVTQSMAVERYLLGEMSPSERDIFEEHYFDCPECAEDVRATDAFLEATKTEFQSARQTKSAAKPIGKSRSILSWKPKVVWAALAASLLLLVYQNFLIYPHLSKEVAELKAPEVLPSLSLVGGNSRGGELPTIVLSKAEAFLLLVDIPTQDRFSSYTCSLVSPSGSLAWHVMVSPQEAKDTISIRVPATEKVAGSYTLLVQGVSNQGLAEPPVDLVHYRFMLTIQN